MMVLVWNQWNLPYCIHQGATMTAVRNPSYCIADLTRTRPIGHKPFSYQGSWRVHQSQRGGTQQESELEYLVNKLAKSFK